MQPSPRPGRHRARRAGAVLLATALAGGVTAASAAAAPGPGADASHASDQAPTQLTWGVKQSFVNYVTGPIGDGTITGADGATWDGDTKLATFPAGESTVGDSTVDAAFVGSLNFEAHDGILDTTFFNLRVEVSGATGALIADVTSRDPEEGLEVPPTLYEDITVVDLDLTAIEPTSAEGVLVWADVPTAITEAGVPTLGGQYQAGDALDPLTFSLPDLSPTVTVTPTDSDLDPCGTTLTVTGRNFDPQANISTRPPIRVGMATGVYVVFGYFADDWKPSDGIGASQRKVINQRWALPAESMQAFAEDFPTNPGYAQMVEMDDDGSFTLTVTAERGDIGSMEGNYGVYTYAAGGAAANASEETFTPVSLRDGFSDVPEDHQFLESITWLDESCVAGGYGDGTFRPTTQVSRQVMASFLYRLAGSPDVPDDAPTFSDVPADSLFEDAIRWMAAEEITSGFGDGTFQPTIPVSRQTTAAFLYRLAGSPEVPEDAPTFSDVPADSLFEDAIGWMAAEEITGGYLDGTFRPTTPVSRQSAAAFLYRSNTPVDVG